MTDINIKHDKLIHGHLVYDHLVGLPFEHGKQDCYETLRNVFKDNLGVQLRPYARPDDWWLTEMDLYMENFEKEGFFQVEMVNLDDIRILDVFLIGIPDSRSPEKTVTNHCAIYVGNGKILHHRLGKLSQVIPYRGTYKNFTTAIIRHKAVPNLQPRGKESSVDLMDLILPHKRELLLGALNDKSKK